MNTNYYFISHCVICKINNRIPPVKNPFYILCYRFYYHLYLKPMYFINHVDINTFFIQNVDHVVNYLHTVFI